MPTMNIQYRLRRLLLVAGILAIFLAASCKQEPILVYVTPTLENTATIVSPVPTIEPATSVAVVPTLTETAVVAEAVGSPTPVATFAGSLIGPEYTLPPTSTHAPTETPVPPTEGPTSPPQPTTPAQPTNPPPTNAPSGPAPTALPNLDASRMGIQLDPTLKQEDWNRAIEDIQRLGVKWLKVQVSWRMLQPNGPGDVTEDFRRLETYLETAFNNGNGLDILVSIAKAPGWSRTNQSEDGPPDDPQNLVNFINLMLQEFGQAIDAVEIWNEPNLTREWSGQPLTGQSYMKYFVPAYNAINTYSQVMKSDPNAPRTSPITVITAGLAPTNGEGAANDRTYLQQMYDSGLGQYPDAAVGIHPYSWWHSPDDTCCDKDPNRGWDEFPQFFFSNTLNDYRDIMVRNGRSDSKMWNTEFGWASWDGLPGQPPEEWVGWVNECQQGSDIIRAFQIGQSLDYMGPMMLWNLNFALLSGMVDSRDERAAYSILVPLEPRERAAYWMIFDAIRPDQQLGSYSRCPGAGG